MVRNIFLGLVFIFLLACVPKTVGPTYGYGNLVIKKGADSTICIGADVHVYVDSAGTAVFSVSGMADSTGNFFFQIETDKDTTLNIEAYSGSSMGSGHILIHPNETTQTIVWCY